MEKDSFMQRSAKKLQKSVSSFDPKHMIAFVKRINAICGSRFVMLLASVYFGIKGVVYYFAYYVELPYYRQAQLSGPVQELNSAIATTPWSLKGLVGVVSDVFPLLGYHKRTYMIISSIVGTAAAISLSFYPIENVRSFPGAPAMLLFLIHFQMSSQDLLCEGKYVEVMKKKPETKNDLVTFVWFCSTVGAIIPSLLVGPISDSIGAQYNFFFFIPFCLQPLIFLFGGGMIDDKVPPEESNVIQWDKLRREARPIILAISMASGAMLLVIVGLFGNLFVNLIVSVVISIILCGMGYICMPRLLADCNLYMFLQELLYVNISGALDYFYTADADCVFNGPHFDFTFYRTYTQIVALIASILGIFLFQNVMHSWSFRSVFWITTMLRVVASLFDLVLVRRWNIAIGIGDKTMYMFGDAIIYNVVYMMNFLPAVILTSKICPKNLEATVYSILAGYQNNGQNAAKFIGSYVITAFGIKTINTPTSVCNYSNLYALVVFCHFFLPLLTIPLTFVLIPDAKISDELLHEDPYEAIED
ncbi:BT1 family protein [Cardiosporidium cionae]|uniref:BT1 family protein n=1 Tax=Cardiosporidium cionae TaxID=476202 RepID=A0ABQ7JBI2_9APIC|nr:BT1 family protein [Cardiosporidium cionae]|eukprot:KAF8821326.1 BT1 family protein [Cardiosporidium cionae]